MILGLTIFHIHQWIPEDPYYLYTATPGMDFLCQQLQNPSFPPYNMFRFFPKTFMCRHANQPLLPFLDNFINNLLQSNKSPLSLRP